MPTPTPASEIKFRLNQNVVTPIGPGIYQSTISVYDDKGSFICTEHLVRLPITNETRLYQSRSNCITPHAVHSGLWRFKKQELQ